ncbi:MFS transporter [Micromonospora orduensis]|uniref:MFS transporter n=1 Tax=Micromonospora orduensis TaxID=1420891 RepID=A0A5C4QRM0_9ACTN|nr:MFS transporter [Micromonospora orduensis]TNH29622.1 MFS transporter [Micromonospora orduensis]
MNESATNAAEPSGSRKLGARQSFPRSSPYWPVISHRLLRRVLPGMAVSSFGDGMSVVAISWFALELAPAGSEAAWVALAVAAYSLPATVGAAVFGRFLAGRGSAQLVYWDATLRGVTLALIPVAYLTGLLNPTIFVVLLAVSSLLHSWGVAGRFTLIAEVLPERQHVPANALLNIFAGAATIAGPPVAGLLIGWQGAALVIALDAVSFLALAVSYLFALRAGVADKPAEAPPKNRGAGLRAVAGDRTLLVLMLLTFAFFAFFGPVYVAFPIYVNDIGGSAALLGLYYTVFGVGSLIGAVASGYAGRLPLWRTITGIILGFGVTLLPLGLGAPVPVSLAAFALGGFIWAPYMALSRALIQRRAEPGRLASVLAANTALIIPAVPLGTIAGGPLVTLLGARGTLLCCAIATIALGLLAVVFLALAAPEDGPAGAGGGHQATDDTPPDGGLRDTDQAREERSHPQDGEPAAEIGEDEQATPDGDRTQVPSRHP